MTALLAAFWLLPQQAAVEVINVTELVNAVMERTYRARTAIAAGDLASARADVEEGRRLAVKARAALERGEPAAADAHLAALARSVEEHGVTRDPPRIKARQNLLLARTRVEQGRYKDAEAPLREAARALGRRDIEDYARRIRREPADALARIDAWLREITPPRP